MGRFEEYIENPQKKKEEKKMLGQMGIYDEGNKWKKKKKNSLYWTT